MKEHKNLIANLREHAQWAEANEWETPIMLSDNLKEAADLIEQQAAEIDAAQTVDAVEVVRCKDCVYGQCEPIKRGTRVCEYYDFIVRNDYDFCSRGERRNDNAAD